MRVRSFEVAVRGPYPCWCEVSRVEGGSVTSLGTFDHRQLRDLEYAVQWMIREAQLKLKLPNNDMSGEV